VKQDFYAKIVSTNLTFMLLNIAQKQVDQTKGKKKYHYQINCPQALSKMKNTIIKLLQLEQQGGKLRDLIERVIRYMAQTTEAIREGRSSKRPDFEIKNRKFYFSYKKSS